MKKLEKITERITEEQFDDALESIENDIIDELFDLKKLIQKKNRDKIKYRMEYIKQGDTYTYTKYKRRVGFK